METTKNNVNIARGGAFNSTIAQLAAARYAYQNNTESSNVGFRINTPKGPGYNGVTIIQ